MPVATNAEPNARRARTIMDWPWQPLGSPYERMALVLTLFVAIAVRISSIWVSGRFWAEEGTIFFSRTWTMSWWDALLAPYANYLNITVNTVGLLAVHLTTVPTAPYFTTTVAIVFQCLPGVLLITSREKWLQNRFAVLVALMLIVLAPVPEEVWANSSNSHIHLMLCAALILAFEIQPGGLGVCYGLVLLLAALSGPACWALLPLFALRAAIDRSGPRAVQGLVLLLGAAVQLLFFSNLGQRDVGTDLGLIGAIVMTKHLLLPLLGHEWAAAPISELAAQFEGGHGPLWPLAAVVSVFAAALTVSAIRPRQPPLWFLLGGAALAGAGYIGAIDQKTALIHIFIGGRHAFAPQVLIGLALLSWTVLNPGRPRILSGVLTGWIVLVGGYNYVVPTSPLFTTGPDWREEVEQWRRNPGYRLKTWPTGWSMALPAK